MVYQEKLSLLTRGHRDMHDLTEDVHEILERSHKVTGIINIHVVGSTGAIGTIEFEPGLVADLPEIYDKLMPPGRDYGHEAAWHDGNAHAHLQATTLGASITVPFAESRMILGTWQQVFLLECDVRPRNREIIVTVIGE